VRATVRERAGRLDPRGRALLEVAAVAGLEVDAEPLASVLPEGRPGDLVSAGLLEQEEDRFRFRHPLLQEAAYDEVPAGRRGALHEQIAAVLSNSDLVPAERIAAHLEQAGRPEAALSALEAAAGKANPGRAGGTCGDSLPGRVPAGLPAPVTGRPTSPPGGGGDPGLVPHRPVVRT
jgi:hypothetical protein